MGKLNEICKVTFILKDSSSLYQLNIFESLDNLICLENSHLIRTFNLSPPFSHSQRSMAGKEETSMQSEYMFRTGILSKIRYVMRIYCVGC